MVLITCNVIILLILSELDLSDMVRIWYDSVNAQRECRGIGDSENAEFA